MAKILFIIGTLLFGFELQASDWDNSVVVLNVTKQAPDIDSPWQQGQPSTFKFLGVALAPDRLITTAYTVQNAVDIEMQKIGDSQRFKLVPHFIDYEVNLAVLRPADGVALPGLKAVSLGDSLTINDHVSIIRARNSSQLTIIPGQFLESGVYRSVTSVYSVISHLIKIQQTGMGWGEPVVKNGRLVGISSGQDQNYVHVIPVELIRHFVTDDFKNYKGFPSLGVMLSTLDSPDVRKMLKADKINHGVRVTWVSPVGSSVDRLKSDDVIISLDGNKILENGYFVHPRWGRIHMSFLLNQKYPGQSVAVNVLRRGEELSLQVPLRRFDSNDTPVSIFRESNKEPHVIFGGLVLIEVSKAFFEQYGDDWRNVGPFDLLYLLDFDNNPSEENKKIVLLSQVLADEFNHGYEKIRNGVVERVNGKEINDLNHLISILREQPITKQGKRYARFEFARADASIILDYDGLGPSHTRIMKTYAIPAESFYGGQ